MELVARHVIEVAKLDMRNEMAIRLSVLQEFTSSRAHPERRQNVAEIGSGSGRIRKVLSNTALCSGFTRAITLPARADTHYGAAAETGRCRLPFARRPRHSQWADARRRRNEC